MKKLGQCLVIRDDEAKVLRIEKDIKNARYCVRDEKNRQTIVYDRLLGLTASDYERYVDK